MIPIEKNQVTNPTDNNYCPEQSWVFKTPLDETIKHQHYLS